MKKVGVAILGLGVVGGGTYRILTDHAEFFRTTQHVDITVESVLEKNRERALALGVPAEKLAANIAEVVLDPDVNIIVECMGGVTDAKDYDLDALNAGKTVVTSNKELFCKYWHELERAAKQHNAGLFFGASCVGGVPVIRTLLDGLQSNEISSLVGVINGTTNYILTEMCERGIPYEAALAEAVARGYAEADPAADVEGYDAAYKLSILSSLAFHTKVPYSKVCREGITKVTAADIRNAHELGYTVKLLAVGKNTPAGIEVRVHPAFVAKGHPLASVGGSYNAVFITGDCVGDVMLYGKGAGDLPTGSAIVSDILYAATHTELHYATFKNTAAPAKDVKFVSDFESAYYLRMKVADEAGSLAKIAAVLSHGGISIERLMQRTDGDSAEVVLVTHVTHESAVANAVHKLTANGSAEVCSVLRVL